MVHPPPDALERIIEDWPRTLILTGPGALGHLPTLVTSHNVTMEETVMNTRLAHVVRSVDDLIITRRSALAALGSAGLVSWLGVANPIGAQQASGTPANEPNDMPVQLIALYGIPTDEQEFERHYIETHVPLVVKIPHLRQATSAVVQAVADGGEVELHRIAVLSFANMDEFEEAATTAETRAAIDDILNFATGGATMLIASVDLTYPG